MSYRGPHRPIDDDITRLKHFQPAQLGYLVTTHADATLTLTVCDSPLDAVRHHTALVDADDTITVRLNTNTSSGHRRLYELFALGGAHRIAYHHEDQSDRVYTHPQHGPVTASRLELRGDRLSAKSGMAVRLGYIVVESTGQPTRVIVCDSPQAALDRTVPIPDVTGGCTSIRRVDTKSHSQVDELMALLDDAATVVEIDE